MVEGKKVAITVGFVGLVAGGIFLAARKAAATPPPSLVIPDEEYTVPSPLPIDPESGLPINPIIDEPIDPEAPPGSIDNPLTPPVEEMPPIIPSAEWYDVLNIGVTIGWSREEYQTRWDAFYQAYYVTHTLWHDELTWEEMYGFYDQRTVYLAQYIVAVIRKQKELGAWYEHEVTYWDSQWMKRSIFHLPTNWTGTRSEFDTFVFEALANEGLAMPS